MESATGAVDTHYTLGDLEERIVAGLRAAGKDPERPTVEDLGAVDNFHIGGRAATLELLALAELEPGSRIVDVGGGIGGAARILAAETGASVTVLDATEEFCRVGSSLSELVGLQESLTFEHGDATRMPFVDASFDAAVMQHASMNIADKPALFAEVARVVRPGGKYALHEIFAGPNGPAVYPTPWAREASLSFLRPQEEVRALLRAGGFTELAWRDVTEPAIAFWQDRLATIARDGPPPLGIHLFLGPEAPAIGQNVLRNLEEGRITVAQAVLRR